MNIWQLIATSACGHGQSMIGVDSTCVLCGVRGTIPDPAPVDEPGMVSLQAEPVQSEPQESDGPIFYDASDPALRQQLIEELQAELAATDEELARRDLYEFMRQGWHVTKGGELEDVLHVRAMCTHIQLLIEGWLCTNGYGTPEMHARQLRHWQTWGIDPALKSNGELQELLVQNVIVNVPPGTLKSTVIMVYAVAWAWLHCPRLEFGCSSANKLNVTRDSRACRDLVSGEWYRNTFHITWEVREDADAIGDWSTTAGARRISVTYQTGFTGTHVHILIIDDPDDAKKVWGEPARRSAQEQWTIAVENRVHSEITALRIVLQQRVHTDDLSGYLIGKGRWSPTSRAGWMQLCIPMLAGFGPRELPERTAYGWRDMRGAGICLQPSRFPQWFLDKKRIDLGIIGFEGQYNGNPEPTDGGMIGLSCPRFFVIEDGDRTERKRALGWNEDPSFVMQRKAGSGSALTTVGEARHFCGLDLDWMTLTVDATFGSLSDTASAVGLLVVGGKGQRRFLFDDITEPMTFAQTKAAIRKLIGLYPITRALIERKANGQSVIDDLKEELATGVINRDGKRTPILGPDGKPAIVVLEPIETGGDGKIPRAQGMVGSWEAGLIFIYEAMGAAKLTKHLAEVCTFPHARRDDRVDAWSQLMAYYRSAGEAKARAHQLMCL